MTDEKPIDAERALEMCDALIAYCNGKSIRKGDTWFDAQRMLGFARDHLKHDLLLEQRRAVLGEMK